MISDNLLGDRLNAVKLGKPLPTVQSQSVFNSQQQLKEQHQQPPISTLKMFFISRTMAITDTFVASLLYGYAIKTVFNFNWTLLGVVAVGFLFNHAISIFPKILFPKLYK